jgi:hypothetical protein
MGRDGVCNCRQDLSVLNNFGRQCLHLHDVAMRYYRVRVAVSLLQSIFIALTRSGCCDLRTMNLIEVKA